MCTRTDTQLLSFDDNNNYIFDNIHKTAFNIIIKLFLTITPLAAGVLGFWGFGEIGRAHV